MSTGERSDDIAIIGMACLFPGAPNLGAFWRNIVRKVDATSDPPPEAWDVDVFYDPDSNANDRVYCKKGGFIAPIAEFDPIDNGVMPRAVEGGEPDQWLALKVAREALADAGYADDIPERRNTAVILGKGTYLNRGNLSVVQHGRMVDQTLEILRTLHPELTTAEISELRGELTRKLPPFNADTAPGLIPNIVAGRIANRLDLMGPNYTVDAACASSLVAVEHSIRGLRAGEYDLALAGGVHVATPVPTLMLFCQLGALSRREEIRPFDALADGTVLGGGLGMLVLKRRRDAERDGNRIYALVKSVGISSDGRGLGVMAPRPEGEELALRRAYDSAGIPPRSVGLIEAHGTGTPVGDATEVEALKSVYGTANGSLPWCGLGSVKSMIGHAMPAAGVAGIIKAALALYHRVLPPTLHVDHPNPKLGLDGSPFYINTESRPWIHASSEAPRRAGVNAFGFGGINAHSILEEALTDVGDPKSLMPRDAELILLAGATRRELLERARSLRDRLESDEALELVDLAFTLNQRPGDGPARLALVASDVDDLRQKLERALSEISEPERHQMRDVQGIYFRDEPSPPDAKLAFLFPGEGSQYLGMLSDLCMQFPEVREHFDAVDQIFQGHSRNFVPSDFIFPRPVFSEEELRQAEERLWQMEGAFEAVLTADWALYGVLRRLSIVPDAILGHSTGEYAAMRAAGMMKLDSDDDVATFARQLNDFYHRPGATENVVGSLLVAVGAGIENVTEVLESIGAELAIAMDNCPHQTVVVGSEPDIDKFLGEAKARGWFYERLAFDRPYHTPRFETYAAGLGELMAEWIVEGPKVELYSCTSRGKFPQDVSACRELALHHWMSPVRFRETIETMYEDGVRIFVEVGPKGNLSSFVSDTLRGRPHLAVPSDVASRPGMVQLSHLLALLAVHGVPLRLDALYAGADARTLDLSSTGEPDPPRKRSHSMKLEVGWIPMEVSAEAAAKFRARQPKLSLNSDADSGDRLSPEIQQSGVHPTSGGAKVIPSSPSHRVPAAPPLAAAPAPDPNGSSDAVMSSYWETMERFLSVQQEVMETFLRSGPDAPAGVSPVLAEDSEVVGPAALIAPVPEQGNQENGRPAAGSMPTAAENGEVESVASNAAPSLSMKDLLLTIVSERTGYPPEMIDLDLDLEADLGIDSIKRVEVLGTLQRETALVEENDMESLSALRTLGQVIEYLESRQDRASEGDAVRAGLPSSEEVASFARPFLRKVVSLDPGRELTAECELDLDEDLFLRDHALGRRVSTHDSDLRGLPVVPLTMGMEMLGEAATALAPDKKVVGMRDVRAFRWMMLEEEKLSLAITARVLEAEDTRVVVSVKIADANVRPAPSYIEGKVVLSDGYPNPPSAAGFELSEERPSSWPSDRLYEEIMFHGPRFRGVESMDLWGRDGATATLSPMVPTSLFASSPSPALVTDPVLLDQPGQVVGFWMAEHLERGYVVFPFQLDELTLFGAPFETGVDDKLECRARIRLIGDELVDSDLDVVAGDGRVLCRFRGWKDRRFDVPAPFLRFLHNPMVEMLTEVDPTTESYRLQMDGFPEDFFTAHRGVWQLALAQLILGDEERKAWRTLPSGGAERLDWLFARLAAKDAIRGYLRATHGLELTPADIEVRAGKDGRLRPAGNLPTSLAVSLSRPTQGCVVAAVEVEGAVAAPEELIAKPASGNGRDLSRSVPSEPIGE